jgi:hypothetical protein
MFLATISLNRVFVGAILAIALLAHQTLLEHHQPETVSEIATCCTAPPALPYTPAVAPGPC